MKKLYVGIIAAICCVAFAVPAMAEVKMGGMISAEQFYWDRSADRMNSQTKNLPQLRDDYNSTEFAMGQPWNRLNMQYISDDKKIGGMIELRTGGQKSLGNANNENNFTWEFAWIDWHLSPNFYLRVGRQTQTFAITSPEQQMGHNHGHIVLANFGNVHGGTSRDGIRAYIKFNDNVRMEIQLLNPDSDAAPEYAAIPRPTAAQGGPGGFALEENVIPRIDLSIPIKFANVAIEPSFTWLKQEYDQVGPGSDDTYDIWGLALGGKVGFGPFSISAEITYGENLGNGGYVGGGMYGARGIYVPFGTATTRFEDTEVLAWWVQLQFDFGPFALQGMVGYQSEENDGDPTIARDASEVDVTRWAYGFQVPINIAKNFKMVPQIWFYDYDDDAVLGGAAGTAARTFNTDLGEEWMFGLFWQLTF